MTTKRGKANGKHPVSLIAGELGVDRLTLTRKLKADGIDFETGITFRQAYGCLSGKFEEENSRRRRQNAEARSAEIDAAEKQGLLILKSKHEDVVAELATQVRVITQSADYIPKESRMRLSKEFAGVKIK